MANFDSKNRSTIIFLLNLGQLGVKADFEFICATILWCNYAARGWRDQKFPEIIVDLGLLGQNGLKNKDQRDFCHNLEANTQLTCLSFNWHAFDLTKVIFTNKSHSKHF